MMANYRLIILFYLWIFYMADIVKSSDQIECNNVQCPPDIKCPSDSYLHVLYEPSQIPPDYDVNDDDDDIVDHNINNYNNNNNNNNNDNNDNKNENSNNNNNKGTTNSIDINNDVLRQNDKLKFNKIQHYENEHVSKFLIDDNHNDNDDGDDGDGDDDDNDNTNNDDYNINANNNNNNNRYLHSITHKLIKRNIQLKRKESIKIVPGDYISLIPDLHNIVSYDQQNVNNLQQNNHKKRKRNIDNVDDDIPEQLPPLTSSSSSSSSPSVAAAATSSLLSLPIAPSVLPLPSSTLSDIRYNLTAECCNPKRLCICDLSECNDFPKCEKFGKITIEIEHGTGEPGNCCTKYACIDHEPNCKNLQSNDKQEFWLKYCMKCECISGERFCQNSCIDDDDVNDGDDYRIDIHKNSRKECFSARKQRPYKSGEMWKEDSCTDCECVNGERICHISSCKPKHCKKQIKLPEECCSICVNDDDDDTEFVDSTITETSMATSLSSTSSSTTTTSTVSDSSKQIAEDATLQPTTALICNYTTMQPTATVTDTTTTATSTTMKGTKQKLSNSDRLYKLLGITKENLVLYGIIVILLILCIVFIALYVHELTRKTSYRSIPSSDSNLCQIPRPLNNKPTTP